MGIQNLKRNDLYPHFINTNGYKVGIEVGVREGYHCRNLLEKTDIYLHGVDKKHHPNAGKVFNEYPDRSKYHILTSKKAVTEFPNDYFDFIHIDASHRYEDVLEDLRLWYPKLKVGGLFSGDDYIALTLSREGKFGVIEAVEEFILDKNVELYISNLGYVLKQERLDYIGKFKHKGPIPQWWFVKPK